MNFFYLYLICKFVNKTKNMLDYKFRDFEDINYEKFLDLIWSDYISEKVVSNAYYAENEEFITAFTFDLYRLFEMDGQITMRTVKIFIESFFFNLFRFKGDNSDVGNAEENV